MPGESTCQLHPGLAEDIVLAQCAKQHHVCSLRMMTQQLRVYCYLITGGAAGCLQAEGHPSAVRCWRWRQGRPHPAAHCGHQRVIHRPAGTRSAAQVSGMQHHNQQTKCHNQQMECYCQQTTPSQQQTHLPSMMRYACGEGAACRHTS